MAYTPRPPQLEIDIFHAVEYRWPQTAEPHVGWPRQYALWLIESGHLQVRIGDKQWVLEPGSVFLAPMRQPRQMSAPFPGGVHWWSLNFIPTWFLRIDPLQSLQEPLVLSELADAAELRLMFQLLTKRWMEPWAHGPLHPGTMNAYQSALPAQRATFSQDQLIVIQGLAHAIFGWCLQALQQNQVPTHLHESIPPWLMQAVNIIEESPDVTVEELAQRVAFSPAQLRRLFHRWLGASPRDYLVERRMDKAHSLLENTNWTVGAIAKSLGFSSAPSFSRLFRSVYGISPAELRAALTVKEYPS